MIGYGAVSSGMGVQYNLQMPFDNMISQTQQMDELTSEISYAALAHAYGLQSW